MTSATDTHLGSRFCVPFTSSPPTSPDASNDSTTYQSAAEEHENEYTTNKGKEKEDEESEGGNGYHNTGFTMDSPGVGDQEGGEADHDSVIWEAEQQTNDESSEQNPDSYDHDGIQDFGEEDDLGLPLPEGDNAEDEKSLEETNDEDSEDEIPAVADDSNPLKGEMNEDEGGYFEDKEIRENKPSLVERYSTFALGRPSSAERSALETTPSKSKIVADDPSSSLG